MSLIPAGALGGASASAIPAAAFSGLTSAAAAPVVGEILVQGARNAVSPALASAISGGLSTLAPAVFDPSSIPQFQSPDVSNAETSQQNDYQPGDDAPIVVTSQSPLNIGSVATGALPAASDAIRNIVGAQEVLGNQPGSLEEETVVTGKRIDDPDIGAGLPVPVVPGDPVDLLAPVASEFVVSDLVNQQGKSLEQEQAEKSGKKGMSTFGKITGGLAILDALGNLVGGGGGGAGAGGATGLDALAPTFRAQLPAPRGQFTPQALGQRPPGEAGRPAIDYARYGYGPARSFFNYVPETQAERDAFAATAAAPAAPRVGVGTVMPQALPGAAQTGATDSVLRAGFEKLRAAVPGASDAELVAFLGTPEGQQELAMIFEGLGATPRAKGGSMGGKGQSRESFAVNGAGTGRSDEIPALLSDGEYVIDAETVALLGDGSGKAGAQRLDEFRAKIRKHKGRNLAKGKFSVNAKRPERYLSGGLV